MTGFMVVEDDVDLQFLVETAFSLDPRFSSADAIDAFLLKTDSVQLLPLAQQLASMHPLSGERWAQEPPL